MKKLLILIITIFILTMSLITIENNDTSLCKLYSEQENIKILYPEEEVIINEKIYKLDDIKKSCSSSL